MFNHHTPRCGLVFFAAAVACLIHLQSHAGESCPQPRMDSYFGFHGITLNHDGTSILLESRLAALLGDVATGKIKHVLHRATGAPGPRPIQAQFDSDSRNVAVYYDDGGTYLWDTSSGLELARNEGDYKDNNKGAVCPRYDSTDVVIRHVKNRKAHAGVAVPGAQRVVMYDEASMARYYNWFENVYIQDVSIDGLRILSFPNILDWESGEILAVLEDLDKLALSAENPRFSMDGTKIIMAGESISVWDGQTGVLIVSGPAPTSTPINSWDCHGDLLVVGSSEVGEFLVLDSETLDVEYEVDAPPLFPTGTAPCDITFSGDGSRFAIDFRGVARTYSVETGHLISEFISGDSGVYSPDLQTSAFHAPAWSIPASDFVEPATGYVRSSVIRVQRQDGSETRIPVDLKAAAVVQNVRNLALSPDGEIVAFLDPREDEFRFHNAISGAKLFNVDCGYDADGLFVWTVCWFSPDSRYFYFGEGNTYQIDLTAPELGAVLVDEEKGASPWGPVEDRYIYDEETEVLDETSDGKLRLLLISGLIRAEVCDFEEQVEYYQLQVVDTETNEIIKTVKGVYNFAMLSEDGQYIVLSGFYAQLIPIFDCDPEANAAAATATILALPGLDLDGNGKLDESEYAGMQSGSPEDFEALDLNGDGALSLAELLRHIPADRPIHNADTNGDGKVSIGELLRLVQFYNSGGYDCAVDPDETEDGYRPDGDAKLSSGCPAHAADYLNGDGVIDLTELLRLIQLYNLGSIAPCDTSEDGFCAVES